ncbi:hypothetical protein B0T16DRAFT_496458 [Cercophora newfieldiana]|uniref:Uncharacterized protein n=1 Tax=Cercophora newfieldiana TaxID=92897 RepID=A0AA40CLG6_9PEZI|nr:hypothetical protein B0T16DRAFT_496458 [Cercophora newfieldiana]
MDPNTPPAATGSENTIATPDVKSITTASSSTSNPNTPPNPTPQKITTPASEALKTTYTSSSAALLARIRLLRQDLSEIIPASPSTPDENQAVVLAHKLDVQYHLITQREHAYFADPEWLDFIQWEADRVFGKLAAEREKAKEEKRKAEEERVAGEAKRVLEFQRSLGEMSAVQAELMRRSEVERVEVEERMAAREGNSLAVLEMGRRREGVVKEGARCREMWERLVRMETGGGEQEGGEGTERVKPDAAVLGRMGGGAGSPTADGAIYRGWEQAYEERVLGSERQKEDVEAFEVASDVEDRNGGGKKVISGRASLTCLFIYLGLVAVVAVSGVFAFLRSRSN